MTFKFNLDKIFLITVFVTNVTFFSPAKADFNDKPPSIDPILVPTPVATAADGSDVKPRPTTSGQKPAAVKPSASKPQSAATPLAEPSSTGDSTFEHDSTAPVNYSAESGSGSRKDGSMELIKNVIITQAQTTMWADKAELFSFPGTTKPRRVLAKGRVKLRKKPNAQGVEMRATADEIEYFADTQKAILRGRPVIQKGKEILRGEQIEVDLVTEAIKVKNPSGIVDPKAENTSKSKSTEGKKRK